MEHYRKSSHTVYDIKYHIVWITKYRKPILKKEIGERVREIIRQICKTNEVEIIKGHVSKDHVHILVSVPPHISVSRLVQALKGKTSHEMMMEYRSLNRVFWGRHMWARGYFVASSGNVTDEVVMKYIEEQGKEPPDGNFKVGE
ncbi:MAG: IS200/IS605 family transposase [Deltaproteobacteria bacterium]|nr:IS200/IS605 family transposase [Deltaproteobacteria bacterium]MCL5277614.1 IS200/IS605 family transposase [Deltaproteobacteria bacterium]